MTDSVTTADDAPRWLSRLTLIAGLALLVLLVVSAFAVHAPSVRPDELGFLLNGQVMIGNTEVPLAEEFRSFYPAGFGFFTAVAAYVGGTIAAQFRISLLVNIAFTLGTVWVLAQWATRHLSLSKRWAWIVAVAVAVAPTVAANSLFAWSESLSRLGLAGLVLLVYETTRRPSWATCIGTGLLAAYLPIVHGRFTLVLPFTAVALVAVGISRDRNRRFACASGIAVAAVAYLLLSRVNVWLRDELYTGSTGKEGRMIGKFLDPANTSSIVRGFVGQSWYLVATTFGILAVGVVVLSIDSLTGLKARHREQWVGPLFTVGASFLVVLTSALQLVNVIRPDHLLYGRYAEVVAPVLMTAGLAAMVTLRRKTTIAWFAGIGAIVLLLAAMTLAAGRDELRAMISEGKFFAAPNAIGLDVPRRFLEPMGYLSVGIFFVGLALVVFVAWRRSPALGIVAVLVLGLTSTTYSATRTIVPYRDYSDAISLDDVIRENSDRNDSSVVVGIDTLGIGGQTLYDYRYLLHPIQIRRVTLLDPRPADLDCIIAGPGQPFDPATWENIAVDDHRGLLLWKRQGLDSC
jgi:hypothetical protein